MEPFLERDEADPTPAEYDRFRDWFEKNYSDGNAPFQEMYRAYSAGYITACSDFTGEDSAAADVDRLFRKTWSGD